MHGKVWMFSHLIDDEDIEFMQHEFISYRQAMDYYNLGYKPIVRLQAAFLACMGGVLIFILFAGEFIDTVIDLLREKICTLILG